MAETPLISVVIPSYNHERFIGDAIESVFQQTYAALELIVVDDGSRDASREIIRSLLARSPLRRAELIEQANAGAHAAITRGLNAAGGEFLAILNSDDAYRPDRLSRLLPALAAKGGLLAFSEVEFINDAGARLPDEDAWWQWQRKGLAAAADCPTIGFALLQNNFSVSSSNFLFHRELWRRLGGFSAHRFCHDWDFLMRSVLFAEPVFVREELLRYRIHQTNSTASLRDVQEAEMADALNRYLDRALAAPPENPLAPAPAHWPHFFGKFVETRPFMFGAAAVANYVEADRLARIRSGVWKDAARTGDAGGAATTGRADLKG